MTSCSSQLNLLQSQINIKIQYFRYNPLGDNPHKFCELCGSDTPGVRCTDRDPYADYAGALNCLREKGDIAFLNDKASDRQVITERLARGCVISCAIFRN